MLSLAHILTLIKKMIRSNIKIRTSKYKNIFEKFYISNCSEEIFVIKNVKKHFAVDMLLVILMAKKVLQRFTKKNKKNETNQK